MRKIFIFLIAISIMASTFSVNAATVPRESAPCNATEHQIAVTEGFVSEVLDEVKNGLGYAEARAKTNRIIFNAFLSGQTNGYSYGELTNIANNAIFQYRDMYLRPYFYIENEEKVKAIIADVITKYANGELDYNKAEFNARIIISICQSCLYSQ